MCGDKSRIDSHSSCGHDKGILRVADLVQLYALDGQAFQLVTLSGSHSQSDGLALGGLCLVCLHCTVGSSTNGNGIGGRCCSSQLGQLENDAPAGYRSFRIQIGGFCGNIGCSLDTFQNQIIPGQSLIRAFFQGNAQPVVGSGCQRAGHLVVFLAGFCVVNRTGDCLGIILLRRNLHIAAALAQRIVGCSDRDLCSSLELDLHKNTGTSAGHGELQLAVHHVCNAVSTGNLDGSQLVALSRSDGKGDLLAFNSRFLVSRHSTSTLAGQHLDFDGLRLGSRHDVLGKCSAREHSQHHADHQEHRYDSFTHMVFPFFLRFWLVRLIQLIRKSLLLDLSAFPTSHPPGPKPRKDENGSPVYPPARFQQTGGHPPRTTRPIPLNTGFPVTDSWFFTPFHARAFRHRDGRQTIYFIVPSTGFRLITG